MSDIKNPPQPIITVCCYCHRVRAEDGTFEHIDLSKAIHRGFSITHSMCPDCVRELYPDQAEDILESISTDDSLSKPREL
ncbi:MAG: hypothetical protein K9M84_13455 [Spirochaetia bacterium]|nr:hypothetical protein [Spirochaetia bacterium]